MTQRVIGVDFSSSPSRRKPIVLASGTLSGAALRFEAFQAGLGRNQVVLGQLGVNFGQ